MAQKREPRTVPTESSDEYSVILNLFAEPARLKSHCAVFLKLSLRINEDQQDQLTITVEWSSGMTRSKLSLPLSAVTVLSLGPSAEVEDCRM